MDKILDKYAWQSRLLPALIVLLPVALAVLAWMPKVESAAKPILTAVSGAGALLLLAYIARDAGKRAERRLLAGWGGLPTTLMLRHSDTRVDPVTKRRYHDALAEIVPGVHLPTQSEEQADPQHADSVYEACVKYLRSQTRDTKKYSLLMTENIGYGFRRNLFGLRSVGFVFVLTGLIGCVWKMAFDHRAGAAMSPTTVICLLLCLALAFVWMAVVTEVLVRQGADDYAVRLLESIDQLASESKPKSSRTGRSKTSKA